MTVVVQGTAVSDPYGNESYGNSSPAAGTGQVVKGEKQESKCRDPIFALLLYGTVAAIAAIAFTKGLPAYQQSETTTTASYTGYMYAALICGVFSFVFSGFTLGIMMAIPEFLVKASLIFSVIITGVWAVYAFISGQIFWGIIGLIFFAISVCYARAVWSRIPFATANLVTATTAVKYNLGVALVAYIFAALALAWACLWTLSLIGVWDVSYKCTTTVVDGNQVQTCSSSPSYGVLFAMFVAFFFAQQVLQNTVHVVTAGVVGTWWFSPEDSGCCAASVTGSFVRAVTTSFGSICFGSLIVAIIQALRQLAHQARNNGDGGVVVCIAECILACLQSIAEYFNQWAFIYVGLYGYSYLEAGKNVFTLFRNRGWDAVIADDLVGNVLFLVSFVVGGIAGVIGLILSKTTNFFDEAEDDTGLSAGGFAFLLGFIIGLLICSVLMSTVGSAVNAVIVLFAEAPAEFQQNYPDLSGQMRAAWMGAFPNALQ